MKLAVYDEGFNRVHTEYGTVPLSPEGLHDSEQVFQTVRQMLRRGRELGATSAGLATYRISVVAWKKDGTPLTPIVTWTDTGSTLTYKRQRLLVKAVAHVPPFNLAISRHSTLMRLLRLQEMSPGLKSLLASGDAMAWTLESYLAYRLTGRFVSDASNAATTGLIHPKTLKEIGIMKSLLKLDLPFPEIVGNAERLGVAEGLELTSLIADQQAACVAEGAVRGDVAKVTNGTGTFVDLPVEGYKNVKGLVPLVLLMAKGSVIHGIEGYLPASGRAIDLLIGLGVMTDYGDLEKPLPTSGVQFVPALARLQLPRSPESDGTMAGLDPRTDRDSVISAVLDYIAFHVRFTLETSGMNVRVLRANGNLSKSTALLKRISAATGLPVERQADQEGTMRGLALLQAVAEDKLSVDDLGSTRRRIEVINEAGKARRDGDYSEWKKQVRSLKSSRA